MRINLLEIPKDGKSFELSRQTTELNKLFSDLIGTTDYHTEFTIRPLETGYELSGKIKTAHPDNCSRCGLDFNQAIDKRFHEILMPKMSLDRNDKYMKSNHFSDSTEAQDSSVVEYEGHHFNAGDYLHEAIALEISTTPAPEVDCNGNCVLCHENVNSRNFGYTEEFPEVKSSPFDKLKGLKLN